MTVERSDGRTLQIFISYRREDAASAAGRLHDTLVGRFGDDHVFMDVDTIEPGVDFKEAIDAAVEHCDVLIALIGPDWLATDVGDGRRRIDNPDDYVRLEIEAALSRNIRVIPALVERAPMPRSDELPEGLAQLARRNALELGEGPRWRGDVDRLFSTLERLEAARSETTADLDHTPSDSPGKQVAIRESAGTNASAAGRTKGIKWVAARPRRLVLLAALLAASAGVAIAAVMLSSSSHPKPDTMMLDAIETELIQAHVPEAIRDSCQPAPNPSASFLRTLRCRRPGGSTEVIYARAHSGDALRAYLDGRAEFAGLNHVTPGACGLRHLPGLSEWHRQGIQTHIERTTAGTRAEGRVLCFESQGRARILWTDTPTKILGDASAPADQFRSLYAWWRASAGPEKERAEMTPGMKNTSRYPDAIEDELLLQHIPPAIRETCKRAAPDTFDEAVFLRAVDCRQNESGAIVQYAYAHSGTALRKHSDDEADSAGLEFKSTGSNGSCASGGGAAGYWLRVQDIGHREIGNPRQAAGRVLCFERSGSVTIEWTDISTGIYGSASVPAAGRSGLYVWWRRSAGPGPLEVMSAGMTG